MAKTRRVPKRESAASLRKRALALWHATNHRTAPAITPAEMRRVVNELEVNQIELQIQNEELRQSQMELAHARDHLAMLYDYSPVGKVTLNEKGVIVEANFTLAKMLRVSRDRLVGRTFKSFVSRDSQDALYLHQQGFFTGGGTVGCDLNLRRKDGSTFPCHFSCAPCQNHETERLCHGVVSDMSEHRRAEEALRAKEEQYRLLFELNPNPMWVFDEKTLKFLAVNQAAIDLYGWSRDEFLGMSIKDIRPPSEVPKLLAQLKCQRGSQAAYVGEWRQIKRDGTPLTVDVTISCINFQGRPARLQLVRDVTELKKAMAALRESHLRFKTVADFTHGWEEWVGPDGNLIYISPACEGITGYSREEFRQRPHLFRQLLHPADRRQVMAEIEKAVANQTELRELEFRVRHRDGRERWVARAHVQVHSPEGVFLGVRASNRDITERKRLELELKQLNATLEQRVAERTALLEKSNQQLRLNEFLVQNASLPICWIAPNGRILRINQAFTGMTGYSEDEAMGLRLFDVMPDYPAEDWPSHWRHLKDGRRMTLERQVRCKAGRMVPVEVDLDHIEFERHAYGFACLRDMSAVRQVEEERRLRASQLAESRDAERARLARDLHDNTAQDLTALKLKIEFLSSRGEVPEHEQISLREMREIVLKLLKDVREMAWELHPAGLTDLGLNEVLRRSCEDWSQKHGIEISYQSDGIGRHSMPQHIETSLFRIAQEALSNVARHAQANHVSVVLQRQARTISMIVEDNGRGFDVEPTQSSAIARRRLGMLGMRERAELAGGTLNIESRPGHGTTIYVRLKLPETNPKK